MSYRVVVLNGSVTAGQGDTSQSFGVGRDITLSGADATTVIARCTSDTEAAAMVAALNAA